IVHKRIPGHEFFRHQVPARAGRIEICVAPVLSKTRRAVTSYVETHCEAVAECIKSIQEIREQSVVSIKTTYLGDKVVARRTLGDGRRRTQLVVQAIAIEAKAHIVATNKLVSDKNPQVMIFFNVEGVL